MVKDVRRGFIMTKKIKSTYDKLVDSLSPQEKQKFHEEYLELILSEMLIALMQNDDISVRKLAEEAGVSPTIVQGIRSGTRKHVSMQSFFKILNGLGCKIIVEHKGHAIPFDMTFNLKR